MVVPKDLPDCNQPADIDNTSSDEELNQKLKEGVQIVFPLPAFEQIHLEREIEAAQEIKLVGKKQVSMHSLSITLQQEVPQKQEKIVAEEPVGREQDQKQLPRWRIEPENKLIKKQEKQPVSADSAEKPFSMNEPTR